LDAVRELRHRGFSLPSVSVYQLWDVESIPATRNRVRRLSSSYKIAEALWLVQDGMYAMGYSPGAGTTFISGPKYVHKWTVHRCREFRHLGFGSGSYSFLPDGFVQRRRDIAGYTSTLSARQQSWETVDRSLNAVFRMTSEDATIRRTILGLRSGIPVGLGPETSRVAELCDKMRRLREVGILEYRADTVSLRPQAFLLTNAISAFLHPSAVPRKAASVD
jgi:coproporphyrinogen III oxidase-like Fe-S oxidoreductase